MNGACHMKGSVWRHAYDPFCFCFEDIYRMFIFSFTEEEKNRGIVTVKCVELVAVTIYLKFLHRPYCAAHESQQNWKFLFIVLFSILLIMFLISTKLKENIINFSFLFKDSFDYVYTQMVNRYTLIVFENVSFSDIIGNRLKDWNNMVKFCYKMKNK